MFSIFPASRGPGIDLQSIPAAISGVVSSAAQTVPLIPAGLGVHEAFITGTMGFFRIAAQKALAIALIDHFSRGYVLWFISAIHMGFASRRYFGRMAEAKKDA